MVADAAWDATPTWDDLTERQRAILFQLARGLSNQSIADELDISLATVRNNLTYLYEMLYFSNRVEAMLWVLAHEDVAAEVLDSI